MHQKRGFLCIGNWLNFPLCTGVLTFVGIIGFNVANMMPGELVNGSLNNGETTWLPHGQGGEVAVCTSTIPISLRKK